jgi:hypothetical protein
VGHSDRLLGQNLGFEIDNHTTVVRLGYYVHAPTRRGGKVVDSPSAPPLAGFEAATGNRTDFVWLPKRRVYTSKSIPVDSRTHMWATPEWKVLSSLTLITRPMTLYFHRVFGCRKRPGKGEKIKDFDPNRNLRFNSS